MLNQTVLTKVMITAGAGIAAALMLVPVGVFLTGVGLMTLHAFGFVSPPL